MTASIKSSPKPFFLETVFIWIVSPFQNFFTNMVNSVEDVMDQYIILGNVAKENEELRNEIDILLGQNNELREKALQLRRVAELMKYQDKIGQKKTVATIIGRDATQWSKMVFINKGTRHGVHKNLPVVTGSGVVGHVIQATKSVSKVLLIIDNRSAVDALFQDSRVTGVVVGAGEGLCKMKYVPIGASMKVGDRILSSGLGGIYPKGLLVGTVISFSKGRDGLFQEVTIKPSVEFSRLEEALVLLS
ncbi:MAG: rod shape-determining protein MreC [Nitrospinae bacterium]|nr:rod shape-determining protein MreC [Nitrospinota bacterium]